MNPRGDAEPFGGAEITQHLFAGSVAIDPARVELVVAKFQDGAKHCVCGRRVMNPGSVAAVGTRAAFEGDCANSTASDDAAHTQLQTRRFRLAPRPLGFCIADQRRAHQPRFIILASSHSPCNTSSSCGSRSASVFVLGVVQRGGPKAIPYGSRELSGFGNKAVPCRVIYT